MPFKRFYQRNKVFLFIFLALLPSILLAAGIYWVIDAWLLDGESSVWASIGWVALIFVGFWVLAALASADKIFFAGKR